MFKCVHLLNACHIYIIKYEIVILRSSACLADEKGALQYGIGVLQLQMKECYKEYLRCFGFSIILHMVEVCSMVISSCLLLQHIYITHQ
jgi:hypothetical protein